MVEIYTDASYNVKDKIGGWAVFKKGRKQENMQGYIIGCDSSFIAECQAVVHALIIYGDRKDAVIYTDCQSIIQMIKSGKVPLSHRRITNHLMFLCKVKRARVEWIKSHNKTKFNELADYYAKVQRRLGEEAYKTICKENTMDDIENEEEGALIYPDKIM